MPLKLLDDDERRRKRHMTFARAIAALALTPAIRKEWRVGVVVVTPT